MSDILRVSRGRCVCAEVAASSMPGRNLFLFVFGVLTTNDLTSHQQHSITRVNGNIWCGSVDSFGVVRFVCAHATATAEIRVVVFSGSREHGIVMC